MARDVGDVPKAREFHLTRFDTLTFTLLEPLLTVPLIMHFQTTIAAILGVAGLASASPIERQTACSSYILINTRGTGEAQGQCTHFLLLSIIHVLIVTSCWLQDNELKNHEPGGRWIHI